MEFIKKNFWTIILILFALSYLFVDWSQFSIFKLIKS